MKYVCQNCYAQVDEIKELQRPAYMQNGLYIPYFVCQKCYNEMVLDEL